MTSGYNQQEVTQRFAGRGLAGFIQKPFQLDELREMLRSVLGR
jgi:CheY-like chemotaxis protein